MKPRIKFCGMTRAEDVRAADDLGVDFIGFIFVASSPRSVTIDQARELRQSIKTAKVVGVFDGNSPEEIRTCIEHVPLDYIQIYGEARGERFSVPVIAAFRGVPDIPALEGFLYALIDKANGEHAVDLDNVAALPSSIREKLFLAGGLTPENVHDAVERVHPFAVDCARGIESSPGIKNHDLMNTFLKSLL